MDENWKPICVIVSELMDKLEGDTMGSVVSGYMTEQEEFRGSRPGQAHFAGTGPRGRECFECTHYGKPDAYMRAIGMRCRKYFELTGKWHTEPLPSGARACKYFEAKAPKAKI